MLRTEEGCPDFGSPVTTITEGPSARFVSPTPDASGVVSGPQPTYLPTLDRPLPCRRNEDSPGVRTPCTPLDPGGRAVPRVPIVPRFYLVHSLESPRSSLPSRHRCPQFRPTSLPLERLALPTTRHVCQRYFPSTHGTLVSQASSLSLDGRDWVFVTLRRSTGYGGGEGVGICGRTLHVSELLLWTSRRGTGLSGSMGSLGQPWSPLVLRETVLSHNKSLLSLFLNYV